MLDDQSDIMRGNYRFVQLLGKGGFANVYLCEHMTLDTQVAIKVLRKEYAHDGEKIAEFYQEARRTAHLRHRYIVRIHECDSGGDMHYYVMDYAPYGSLRQYCRPDNLLPLDVVVRYIKQAAEALQFMRDEGFIHRDVKPENLLISPRRNIWLCDLGIAVAIHGEAYVPLRDIRGTSGFVAPEQYRYRLYPASDQYSLAVVAYELLVGDSPFHGTPAQVREQHQHLQPPSLRAISPAISPAVERVVMKALSKDPRMRYSSVMAFANALEGACVSGQASRASIYATGNSVLRRSPVRYQPGNVGNMGNMGNMPVVEEQLQWESKYSEPLRELAQSSDAVSSRAPLAHPVPAQNQYLSSARYSKVGRHQQPQPQSLRPKRGQKAFRQMPVSRYLNIIEKRAFCVAYSVITFCIASALYYVGVELVFSFLIALVIFLVLQILVLPGG